jgi:hypothetical protein
MYRVLVRAWQGMIFARQASISIFCHLCLYACSSVANQPTIPRSSPEEASPVAPRIEGIATYEDDTPAAAATITITSLDSGDQVAVAVADLHGRFAVSIAAGTYALAATTEHGAAWIERRIISGTGIAVKLTKECESISGRVERASTSGVQVKFGRHSFQTGDTFITPARRDGTFSLCVPRGQYTAFLTGSMLSTGVRVAAPPSAPVQLRGYPTSEVKRAPEIRERATYDITELVSDILRAQPLLIGLGEATHGSAEFVTMRSKLTFELARRAQLQLVLLENDAIAASSLDTYLALAARSLVIQVGYMDGDTASMYDARRDEGMAQLARFIVDRLGVRRACLWAHGDHVARISEGSESVGLRLAAAFANNYYPIGFYLYEGTSRAWDAAGKIGVISHAFDPAPAYTVESVLLSAATASDVVWIPLRRLSQNLRAWLDVPRYVRALGAVYGGPERTMLLLNIVSAFDAVVVIEVVHDSSPTPTGVREVKQ